MLYILTKSQIWGLDAAIAFAIFMGGIIFFYKFSVDLSNSENTNINNLISSGTDITNLLLNSGYPPNWNLSNVIIIGLTDQGILNESKVYQFSLIEYQSTRSLLSTKYNYYVFFELLNDTQLNIGNVTGIGKSGVNSTNILIVENPLNVIKIDRLVVYNATMIRMKLYIW